MIIGVISDTHGLLRPEAVDALRGSELILHAGDIGRRELLDELRAIAPVTAVRGNVDPPGWSDAPATQRVEAGQVALYMLHNIDELDLRPEAAGCAAVIFGHSHHAGAERRNGVLYFNPGSAGPKRFHLPVTVGRLVVTAATVEPEIIRLKV